MNEINWSINKKIRNKSYNYFIDSINPFQFVLT